MTREDAEAKKALFKDINSYEWEFMVRTKNPIVVCKKCSRPGTIYMERRKARDYSSMVVNHTQGEKPCRLGRVLTPGDAERKIAKQNEMHSAKIAHVKDYASAIAEIIRVLEKYALLSPPLLP